MTTLQRYETPARRDWLEIMAPSIELAKAIAHTEFVPKTLRGNPAAISAAILYGDEVGLGPMQALAKIAVIDGKPTLAAEAQRALILAAGHDLWVEEATNTRVTVAGRRKDSDQSNRITWTMDDAKRANLAGKPNWRTYPRAMLLARATAELARAVFADAIGGLAATEEIEEQAEAATEISSAPSEPATATRRRRRTTPLAAVSAAPPEAPALPGEEPESAAGPGPTPASAGSGLVEDAPEPPAAELITEPQRKKLHAAFREAGFDNREARLAFTTFHIRRKVESSNELSKDEASKLIDLLERDKEDTIGEDELLQQLEDTLDAEELPPEPS